jgi:hypothetical protein
MASAFVGPILAGISGLAGLFGGGKQKQTTSSQTSKGTQTQSGSFTGSTTPTLSPLQEKLSQMFSSGAMNLYNQGNDMTQIRNQGLQDIGQTSDVTNKAVGNMLAQRGLSFSPAAATTQTQNLINQGNTQSQFLQSLPLLQRQFQQQNIAGLTSAFGALPTGTTQSGTNNGTTTNEGTVNQTGDVSGNPLAGLFGGVGSGLAAWLPELYKKKNSLGGYSTNDSGQPMG